MKKITFGVFVVGGLLLPLKNVFAVSFTEVLSALFPILSSIPNEEALIKAGQWTFDATIGNLFELLSWLAFLVSNFFLGITMSIFETSIIYSLNTSNVAVDAIKVGWATMRDVSNMFFIFILLYIAIATILQAGTFETRRTLIRLIVIALLVNFSLFFTQVVIDTSNIFSAAFYNEITVNGTTSMTQIFGEGLRPQSLFDKEALDNDVLSSIKTGFAYVLGTVTSLVLMVVLGAVAVLFVSRTVILMFVMVLSPLAFIALILDKTKRYFTLWFNTLLSQAFFAPFFLLLMILVTNIIKTKAILQDVPEESKSLAATVKTLTTGPESIADVSAMAIFLQYALIIGLITGALTIARSLSLSGAALIIKQSTKFFGGGAANLTGFALRRSAGFASNMLSKNKKLQEGTTKGGVRGVASKLLLKTAQFGAQASYDVTKPVAAVSGINLGKTRGKGGYAATEKRREEEHIKFAGTLPESLRPGYAARIGGEGEGKFVKAVNLFEKMVGVRSANVAAAEKISRPLRKKGLENEKKEVEKMIVEIDLKINNSSVDATSLAEFSTQKEGLETKLTTVNNELKSIGKKNVSDSKKKEASEGLGNKKLEERLKKLEEKEGGDD